MSTVAIPHDIEPHPLTGMYNGKFGVWLFLASEVMLFGALFSTYVLLRVGAPEGTWPMHGLTSTRGDQILNVWLAFINTLVLITSSVTMVMAWASLKMKDFAKGRLFLTATFALAGVFLVIKFLEYKAKFTHHQVVLRQPLGLEGEKAITVNLENGGERSIAVVNGHIHERGEDYVVIEPDPQPDEDTEKPAKHFEPIRIESSQWVRVTTWGPNASTFLATYFTLTGLHGLHVIGGMIVIGFLIFSGPGAWTKMPEKFTNRVECTGLYWHFVDLVWIFLFPVMYLL